MVEDGGEEEWGRGGGEGWACEEGQHSTSRSHKPPHITSPPSSPPPSLSPLSHPSSQAVGSQVPPTVATVGDAVTFAGGAFSEYAYVRSSSVFRIKECSPEAVALSLSAVTACVVRDVGSCQHG